MRLAIISDIHANLPALQAVLKDIEQQGIDYAHIICLGDVVGYGPKPLECVEIAMRFRVTICGNHDWAVLHEPFGFNRIAREAILWTRSVMKPGPLSYVIGRSKKRYWDFLRRLPRSFQDGDFLFVHGSPRSPLDEYVLRSDLDEILNEMTPKLKENFEKTHWVAFCGHSHIPVILTSRPAFLSPKNFYDTELALSHDYKYIINIGSVGQPRDRDPRACYVILDTSTPSIRYRRVEYDISATQQMIHEIPELDDALADRLEIGA